MDRTAAELTTRLVVGMEIHVELATRAKMFSSAPNVAHPDHFDAEPNTLLDPVVIGLPGVLPVINRRAVEMAMLVGLALNCRIAGYTKWDRKSYYYPDLPKNYQISQYDQPLCVDGSCQIPSDEPNQTQTIRIIRAHLEEDAGKLLHEAPGGVPIDHSIVDLNRAGTPLLEIVTYPDFASAEQAVHFARLLRQICRHLGVSHCIMQRGQMRFEPNINVIIEQGGTEYRTPIVEIKNLNSFKALENAIRYEQKRQVDRWLQHPQTAAPGTKSTRGWDDVRNQTVLQREKEEAHDYRYFPDPDLVPLKISDAWIGQVRCHLGERPDARKSRYVNELALPVKDAGAIVDDPYLCRFFDQVMAEGADPRRAASMLRNAGARLARQRGCTIDQLGITAAQLKGIIDLVEAGKIGSTGADELFGYCLDDDRPAQELAAAHRLLQISGTEALAGFVDQVLVDPSNSRAIADMRSGKDKAVGALIGHVMKLSKGQANPQRVVALIREKLQL